MIATIFLINMEFSWLEALSMFVLFAAQFVLPPLIGGIAIQVITSAFFAWILTSLVAMLIRRRFPAALASFLETWRKHVQD